MWFGCGRPPMIIEGGTRLACGEGARQRETETERGWVGHAGLGGRSIVCVGCRRKDEAALARTRR